MPKLLKDDPLVMFMTGDQGPFRCGHCRFFNNAREACSKVTGHIDADDCCNLYRKVSKLAALAPKKA